MGELSYTRNVRNYEMCGNGGGLDITANTLGQCLSILTSPRFLRLKLIALNHRLRWVRCLFCLAGLNYALIVMFFFKAFLRAASDMK